jgi:hypothetical protein
VDIFLYDPSVSNIKFEANVFGKEEIMKSLSEFKGRKYLKSTAHRFIFGQKTNDIKVD